MAGGGVMSKQWEEKLGELREILVKRDPMESLMMVDGIERLGVSKHFEKEVHAILTRHYSTTSDHTDASLHHVSLSFRLLRQHGFPVSPDVFNSFKGEDGLFNGELRQDIRGLLELFDAAQLSFQGENILDEAQEFSTKVLHEYCSSGHVMSPQWSNEIRVRLSHPYHKTITRLTQLNIPIHIETINYKWGKALRELVQLDFCMQQFIYKDELLQVSRWWNGLGLVRELKLARNQPVKWYTWSMTALMNHTDLSVQRLQLTKSVAFIYLLDDIFDLYGTLDELAIFTEAVKIWDHAAIDMLPSYMKMCYKALLDTTNEISNLICKMHGHNPISQLKETWASLCNAFLVEGKWLASNDLPRADEYLDNGKVSSGAHVVLVHLFFLLGLGGNHESKIHLKDTSRLISSMATILRLWDDLGSAKDEHQDGRDGSYIACYMKDHPHSSLTQARQHLMKRIETEWKCLNRECFSLCNSSNWLFAEASLNLARMVSLMYGYDDNQRLPILEEYIKFMFHNQTSLDQRQNEQEQQKKT